MPMDRATLPYAKSSVSGNEQYVLGEAHTLDLVDLLSTYYMNNFC